MGKSHTNAQLRVWGFLLKRRGGTPVRLHPQWSTTKVETCAGEGHEAEVETPAHGLGESDGMGHLQALQAGGQPEDSDVRRRKAAQAKSAVAVGDAGQRRARVLLRSCG